MNNFPTPLSTRPVTAPGPSSVPVGSEGAWGVALLNHAQGTGLKNFPRLGEGGPRIDASAARPAMTADQLEQAFLAAMGVPRPAARPAWA